MKEIKNFIRVNNLPKYGSDGVKLITKEKFIELVKLCEKKQVEITGFETFFLHGESTIQPSMALSPDISCYKRDERNSKIVNFLDRLSEPNIAFEVYFRK